MNFVSTGAVGALGTVISVTATWPQAIRVWNLRHDFLGLAALSRVGQVLAVASSVVWATYGLLVHSFWTAAPGLFNAPLSMAVLAMLLRKPPARSSSSCLSGTAAARQSAHRPGRRGRRYPVTAAAVLDRSSTRTARLSVALRRD